MVEWFFFKKFDIVDKMIIIGEVALPTNKHKMNSNGLSTPQITYLYSYVTKK